MHFIRLSDYVKTVAAAVVVEHLFVNKGLALLLSRPELSEHPFPIALPLATLAGIWGWWIIYRSPVPVEVRCNKCGRTHVER